MLQSIRDRAQGVLAWVIVALIVVPFALWGIEEYVGDESEIQVAKVDDAKISQRVFQQAYENQRQRLRTVLGDKAPTDETKIKHDVLDGLIENELVKQSVTDMDLHVSNTRLAEEIQAMQAFQDNGKFSKTAFTEQLRRQGQTPDSFGALVRKGLLAEQVNTSITSLAVVSENELERSIKLQNQKRDIGYLILPWSKFKDQVTVDDAAIKKYYDDHRDTLMNPEQVSIEYLELSAAALAAGIKPDDQEIQKLYEEQSASFQVEGKRRASEIVIPLQKDADLSTVAANLSKADALFKRLNGGADFAKLAAEASQDPVTAARGGDLGLIGRGVLSPELEQALFSLAKPGDINKPIKDAKGFHIIKLTEIQPPQTRPLAEVRPQLVKDAQQRKAQQLYFDKIEPLTNLVYENIDTLTVAAKELGLPIKTSKLFDRKGGGGEGITSDPKIVTSAFSTDVLGQGYNSEPIELGENHLVVLRVKEHKPASARTLADVKPMVTEQLRQDAAQKKAETTGAALQKRLSKGEDPAAVAKQFQVEWNKPVAAGRTDAAIAQPAIVTAAFKLPKPAATLKAPPSVGGQALDNGDYAVIGVYAVRDGDPAKLDASEKLAMRRQIQRTQAQYEYQSYVDELRTEAKIQVYQDKL